MNRQLHIDPEYPYVYETHLHTCEASACARSGGADMARRCKEAGYTGIIVTDHFVYGNTAIDRSLPWENWVNAFCKGYEHAKQEGDRIGLQVFFGWEACYRGTEFLINGLSKEWLLAHPEIRDCTIEEQFELVHADGGMVVHCHPFREESYIPEVRLFPEYTDAVETVNATHSCVLSGSHNDPQFDERAKAYAEEHDFPQTAGSDIHRVDLFFGGIAFKRKLADSRDYIRAVMGREPSLLLNGNESV
ncbi:MAG: PHP domain-containing protein [Lachnospiraceae bacterium]|nr:PHP domain-containing protein [Lachnospiraceae bacterium]